MSVVKLKSYKVTNLTFANTHENGQRVELGHKISYNVKYSNNNVCVGRIETELVDKEHPEKFGVKLTIDGVFEFDTNEKKEVIHVQTFKELYPVAKAVVISLSTNAGIPPLFLPPFDIEGQSIYKFEKNV